MSVKFVSAIVGPEMGAPILWTPGKSAVFLQEKTHVHKIPRFRGGGILGFGGGGGSADYIFMGARILLTKTEQSSNRGRDSQPCPRPQLNSQPQGPLWW